jgi:AraC-like DNA-binding protein
MLALFDFVEGVQCWVKDRNGVYQWANRAFLLNYSIETDLCPVVGKTDDDLSPTHLAQQFRLDDERVLQGEPVLGRLELVGRFDHVSTWCLTTKLPLRDAQGAIVGTAGITRPADLAALDTHTDLSLGRVLAYMRQHYAQNPSNAALATVAGRSVRALERLFIRELHMTPQHYLRRVRVRLSCHDLVYSSWSLSEVALRHGFCDQSHFTREFRLETGLTPKNYRHRYQPQANPTPL